MLNKFSFIFLFLFQLTFSSNIDFIERGGIPDDNSETISFANNKLFNETISNLKNGDIFIIPNKTFYLVGGIYASNLTNITIKIDGTIIFSGNRNIYPKNLKGEVMECILLENLTNVTFTSSGKGTFDGNGYNWWGAINYLIYEENRPRLFYLRYSKNVIVENLLFKNSPFWSFLSEFSDGLIIRFCDVDVRITKYDYHSWIDMTAFNTDGFDVTGNDVYIHDCNVWNQDDCVSIKDGSTNMLIERVNCSGIGLVIGSIGESEVRNITFRNCHLKNTLKGIYIKTRWSDKAPIGLNASITEILFENITMDKPAFYSIWIGPAQQIEQPCSLLWPHMRTCPMSGFQIIGNITLRNIYINDPEQSPGVIMGNSTYSIKNITFDNVIVRNPKQTPFEDFYYCEGVEQSISKNSYPIPPCFTVFENEEFLS